MISVTFIYIYIINQWYCTLLAHMIYIPCRILCHSTVNNTKAIIHMEVSDSREVDRHSSKMERLLIDRGLQHLLTASLLVIWEIISDASRNIISLMSKYTSVWQKVDFITELQIHYLSYSIIHATTVTL